jgi:hypothetical protein
MRIVIAGALALCAAACSTSSGEPADTGPAVAADGGHVVDGAREVDAEQAADAGSTPDAGLSHDAGRAAPGLRLLRTTVRYEAGDAAHSVRSEVRGEMRFRGDGWQVRGVTR